RNSTSSRCSRNGRPRSPASPACDIPDPSRRSLLQRLLGLIGIWIPLALISFPISAIDDNSKNGEERVGQDQHQEDAVRKAAGDESSFGRGFQRCAAHRATLRKEGHLKKADHHERTD